MNKRKSYDRFESCLVYGGFKHKVNILICEFRTPKKSLEKLFSRPKRPIDNLVDQTGLEGRRALFVDSYKSVLIEYLL